MKSEDCTYSVQTAREFRECFSERWSQSILIPLRGQSLRFNIQLLHTKNLDGAAISRVVVLHRHTVGKVFQSLCSWCIVVYVSFLLFSKKTRLYLAKIRDMMRYMLQNANLHFTTES